MSAILLNTIGGVIAFALTVWGVVWPVSHAAHRFWFGTLGAVGVLAITFGAFRGAAEGRDTSQQLADIQKSIGHLSPLVQLGAGTSPDEILRAIAARLAEQDKDLQGLHPRTMAVPAMVALATAAREFCTGAPGIPVTAANSDHEAQVLATSIARSLKAGGCQSDLALPIPGLRPDVVGVHIGVRALSAVPPLAVKLRDALNAAGIPCDVAPVEPNFFEGAEPVVIVGSKPS